MDDLPERIWAGNAKIPQWFNRPVGTKTVEYLRADHVADLLAEERWKALEAAVKIAMDKHDAAAKWAAQYLVSFDGKTDSLAIADAIRALSDAPAREQHPDDAAVDRFAAAMKAKLAKKRADGRGGWQDKDDCSQDFLSDLLRGHVEKGDPVDVANFAMMLHQRGEAIISTARAEALSDMAEIDAKAGLLDAMAVIPGKPGGFVSVGWEFQLADDGDLIHTKDGLVRVCKPPRFDIVGGHFDVVGGQLVERSKPQRCAECDCENGGEDCNWIAVGPAPARASYDERAAGLPGDVIDPEAEYTCPMCVGRGTMDGHEIINAPAREVTAREAAQVLQDPENFREVTEACAGKVRAYKLMNVLRALSQGGEG